MKKKMWRLLLGLILLVCLMAGCGQADIGDAVIGTTDKSVEETGTKTTKAVLETETVSQQGHIAKEEEYTSKDEVALYLHTYDRLPGNFITKNAAKKLGWVSKEGNLQEVAPGKSIGGDSYSNREETLPKETGRKYKECDINYHGGYRKAERIIYSNDGLIYYTDDHYNTFTLLYSS